MIDVEILEKLRTLRDKYKDEHPDALRQIAEWEQNVQNLAELEEFSQHSVTHAISDTLKGRIKDIMLERATKQGHTPDTLKALDLREYEIRYLLSLFLPRYEDKLELLTQLIDDELQ